MSYINEELIATAKKLKETSGAEAAYILLINILTLELKKNKKSC